MTHVRFNITFLNLVSNVSMELNNRVTDMVLSLLQLKNGKWNNFLKYIYHNQTCL